MGTSPNSCEAFAQVCNQLLEELVDFYKMKKLRDKRIRASTPYTI